MLYVANAFSIQMLAGEDWLPPTGIDVAEISAEQASQRLATAYCVPPGGVEPTLGTYVWAVGHADTSAVIADLLGIEDPGPARVSIHLEPGDRLIVGQVVGGRLPEGATTLPEGFCLRFFEVEVAR